MALLAPSILSADFFTLGEEIKTAIECGADWMHIDVMDGHFVPQLSFGSKICADIKKNIPDAFCDAHLMVTNPDHHIPLFVKAGADLITIHAETALHGDRLINLIKESGIEAGISCNPTTPVSSLFHYLPLVDLVLVMSVNPGFSGQKCIPYTFDKVKELANLREKNGFSYKIQVDGGITSKNANEVVALGADVVVAGSGFYGLNLEEKKEFARLLHSL